MYVHEIRLYNLRRLLSASESANAFAEQAGIDPATLSRVAGRNPTEPIGDKIARKIEQNCGLNPGSLSSLAFAIDLPDQPVEHQLLTASPTVRRLVALVLQKSESLDPHLLSGLAMFIEHLCQHAPVLPPDPDL